jgi:hypothetical protein
MGPVKKLGTQSTAAGLLYAASLMLRARGRARSDDSIRTNFNGALNTTVTAMGGDGVGGWDRPGTLAGLWTALEAGQFNANVQLVLFVTGPGDQHALARDVEIPAKATAMLAVPLPAALVVPMRQAAHNEPGTGVTLYSPGATIPASGEVALYLPDVTTVYTNFVAYPVDLNGDANLDALGEGMYLVFAIPEADLLRTVGNTGGTLYLAVENRLLDTVYFGYVSVDSGPLYNGSLTVSICL